MKPWHERPIEIRNLFNPAFCGVILTRAIKAFEQEDGAGMPFSLSLLVLPLCLHRRTRETVRASNRAHFLKVVGTSPEMLVGFPERARSLLPYAMEALGLLMHLGCIEVTGDGRIKLVAKKVKAKELSTLECQECEQAARLVGREFGRLRDRVTIYTTLGVKP